VGAQAVGSLDARTQARGSYTVVARITDAAGCYTRVDSINVWLENPVARTKAQNLRVQGNIPLHLVAGTLPVEPADRLEGAARFDLAGPISAQTLGTEAQILTADARHGPHDDSIMADASTVARRSRVSIDLGTLCYDLTAQPGCWTLPDLWADAGANDLSSYAGVQVVPRYGAIYSYGGVAGMGEWVQASSSSLGTHMTGGADVWHKHAAAYIAAIGLNQPLLNEGAYQGLPIADEYQVGPFHAWIGRVDARSGSLFAEVTSTVLRVEVNEGPYHGEIVFGESYAGVTLGAASLLKGPPRFMDPQDDFGAGGDAPVTPMASGAPVLGPGVYAGQLEDQDRNDSFRVSALPGQKLKVVLQPSHRMTVLAAPAPTLPATDAAPRYIRLTLTDPSNRTRDTSFLAVDAHPAEVELNVDEIGLWGVRIDRTDARNETAPYTVAVALSPIMVLDGEGPTGVDAGACGAGMPITGAIEGGMDQFDAVDTFTVTVPARGNLTATLVMPDLDGQDLDLRLLSPTCALLQESATHGPGAKGVAESIVALEMAAGTYSVQVVRHNGIGSYALETVVAG
jgi:hypothetical protein